MQEGLGISNDEFYRRLEAGAVSTSSQPGAQDFLSAYRDGVAAGDEVISIHIGSALSGTLDSAHSAAAQVGLDSVHLVDSGAAGLGLGFLVMEAARAAAAGVPVAHILADLEAMTARTTVYFLLPTVKYLVQGGRIGRAAGVAASLLRVRPLLTFVDGTTSVVARARSERASLAQLWRRIDEAAGRGLRLAGFHYATNRDEVDALRGEFTRRHGMEAELTQLGPAVGAHSGPRIVGVVLVEA